MMTTSIQRSNTDFGVDSAIKKTETCAAEVTADWQGLLRGAILFSVDAEIKN
jgi:hypothetical protein